ncbi:type I-E CRISPR-associated endonuclease Cas1e [Thorsellia kenyensis]|uniref:CRISPR-associated endonuclease Cas1 n=1 Tax=Thorsellia kenyensis TaxID=1549888 RepID=A0ABV6C736_9GAMM
MAFIPLKPIPLKDRVSMIFIAMGRIDVKDGAFVVIDDTGERMLIPIGSVSCLMLEPGTRISHAAIKLCAQVGTLVTWIGEGGVRFYSAGQPGGARADKLLYQAKLALDEQLRLKVVQKMFEIRFGESAPKKRSIEQLRGLEGNRVRVLYAEMASKHGIKWNGRNYDRDNWGGADIINRAISAANSCLYGITEAAILASGYAPAIGFLHTGKPLSFVYDIADIIKFDTVVPAAFSIASKNPVNVEKEVRVYCREVFRNEKIVNKLFNLIEQVLSAGEIALPEAYKDSQPPAIPNAKKIGDEGHRSK